MSSRNPRTIDAVEKTCRIIEALREQGETGITDLTAEVGFSKSTVHGHLATLVREGLVIKDGHSYRLSLRFLDVAESIVNDIVDNEIVREQVRELAENTGEVVHFGTEENGRVVYLSKSLGDAAVMTESRIGKQMPMHSTSLGKAILAEFPREQVDEIVAEHGLPARTPNTITDSESLHEDLAETRERGFSIDDKENIPGVRCIGASVTLPEGEVIGALSISGPSERMTDERIYDELQEELAQAANVIEVNSMYS
ncbi:IclR family transcriptional regulator [Haloparvum sp. PAK95]|uniref:IclR family transcriptional regulator n=1 Tax=Haloparvum sp. PAK95 TaxID=3418962 RepID=UPI003D2F35A1